MVDTNDHTHIWRPTEPPVLKQVQHRSGVFLLMREATCTSCGQTVWLLSQDDKIVRHSASQDELG